MFALWESYKEKDSTKFITVMVKRIDSLFLADASSGCIKAFMSPVLISEYPVHVLISVFGIFPASPACF